MSKAVLISIQPKWCSLIANGQKTVEVRKTRPKLETPFKCYIYCTLGKAKDPHELLEIHGSDGKIRKTNGMVIGEFVCDKITMSTPGYKDHAATYWELLDGSCLTADELMNYGQWQFLYGWRISDLVIYDTPKRLSEFYRFGAIEQENLDEELCDYCKVTRCGGSPSTQTPNGYWACEGRWCSEAYQEYLDENFAIARAPQSWCYVEELPGGADHDQV